MSDARAHFVLRLTAFVVDWMMVALWGGLLFGVIMLVTGGDPHGLGGPWKAQAVGFVCMTLPFTLYFAFCESSRWQASIGKRVVGLAVLRRSGGQLSFGRALLRSGIKFVPWEFGNTLAQQAFFGADGEFPMWLWGPTAIAGIGPLWWLVVLFVTGGTPYDRWVGARVNRRSDR